MNYTNSVLIEETSQTTAYDYPQPEQYSSQFGSTSLYEEKVSVDDRGPFVPGEFRVNPYYVRRRAFSGTAADEVWSETLWVYYHFHLTLKGYIANNANVFNACNSLPLPDYETKREIAVQKVYGRVGQAELDVGVELGEFRETLDTLRHPLKSFRDFFLKHGARNLKDYKRLLTIIGPRSSRKAIKRLGFDAANSAADTWMELRYGVRPIIKSIESIAEYLEEQVANLTQPEIRRKRTFTKYTDKFSLPQTGIGLSFGSAPCDIDVEDLVTVNARVYYKMAWERTMAQELGLSPANIPEILWELTRLSFVADWAFSIGPWLATLRVKPGIEILGDTSGIKIDRTCRVSAHWKPYYAEDNVKDVAQATFKDKSYRRVVNTGPPLSPKFLGSENYDLFKMIDSLALILQPLLRKM